MGGLYIELYVLSCGVFDLLTLDETESGAVQALHELHSEVRGLKVSW